MEIKICSHCKISKPISEFHKNGKRKNSGISYLCKPCRCSYLKKKYGSKHIPFVPLPNEIWKDIIGQEGRYQISNLGRVASLARTFYRNGVKVDYTTYIKKNTIQSKDGYFISRFNKRNNYIHRLIAQHFIPNPDGKPTINHKNGIKTDNRIDNLEWATYSENNQHAWDTGLKTRLKKVS